MISKACHLLTVTALLVHTQAWVNRLPTNKNLITMSSFSEKPASFMEVGETQFLDKSGFIKGRTNSQLSFQREAELQHGRLAMLSIVLLQYLDSVDKSTLAINQVSSLPLPCQFGLLFTFGALEFNRLRQFEDFRQQGGLFTMKDDSIPGNVFKTKSSRFLQNVELNNGRLAMFGALGYIAQELATQIPPI